jgi:hypothetical protein
MLDLSSLANLYDLSYPSKESIFTGLPFPQSPIDYKGGIQSEFDNGDSEQGLDTYDTSYLFHNESTEAEGILATFPSPCSSTECADQTTCVNFTPSESPASFTALGHPDALWFHWTEGSGHSGYQVMHKGRSIQCQYLRYGVYDGVPYGIGTEGVDEPQFAWEICSVPRLPLEVPGVNDQDLNLFVKDIPFNFAVEQALESLGDPGALAEVTCLHTLIACVPAYAELTHSVQELSKAVHKFQKGFNKKTSQVVLQLEATKKRMEATCIKSRTHLALQELIRTHHLRGKFYWPEIPGVPENPDRHYFQVERAQQKGSGSNVPSAGSRKGSDSADRLGCVSPSYQAMQRAFNVCWLCEKAGHWIWECEEPHKACCRPFCQLWHDHPSFYMHECPFPWHQIGKWGGGK